MMATLNVPKVLGSALLAFALIAAQQDNVKAADGKARLAAPELGHKITLKNGGPGAKGKQVPGSYIVTVSKGKLPKGIAKEIGATPAFEYTAAVNGFAAKLTQKQIDKLSKNPHVVSIEPDYVVEGDGKQVIGASGQPWGIDRIDQRPRALSRTYSWYGTGAGVTAYIIDSGIYTAHPDFGGRAINLFDSIRDGRNGQDCHGHGTHVAGSVGGARYGVAKNVKLRGIRVLDCNNAGTEAGVIAGVEWVKTNAVRPAVANISIESPYSGALNTAVTNLTKAGVFVAVAAGNKNKNACNTSPASAPGTLTVASSDWNDKKASDSNWGTCVDLYAPGVSIASAGHTGGEKLMSGTSMASPHVTGVAALIKGDYGDITSPNLVNYILSYSTPNVIYGNVTGTPNRLLFQAGW